MVVGHASPRREVNRGAARGGRSRDLSAGSAACGELEPPRTATSFSGSGIASHEPVPVGQSGKPRARPYGARIIASCRLRPVKESRHPTQTMLGTRGEVSDRRCASLPKLAGCTWHLASCGVSFKDCDAVANRPEPPCRGARNPGCAGRWSKF